MIHPSGMLFPFNENMEMGGNLLSIAGFLVAAKLDRAAAYLDVCHMCKEQGIFRCSVK